MHEHSLNGIVHLFAVFCALAGTRQAQAAQWVDDYLASVLGLRPSDPSAELFRELLDLYSHADANRAADRARTVAGLCARLDALLSPDEKQSFLLHALQIRHALPDPPPETDALLRQAADALRVPPSDLLAWSHFVAAGPESADLPDCRLFRRDGWIAAVVVLRSQDARRYDLRLVSGEAYLDGNPLLPGRFHRLDPGAILRDASGRPVYRCEIERLFAPPSSPSPLVFAAQRLSYAFPNGQTGIRDFSFRETAGRLVGVMGGSGTGKSTLLALLSGSLKPQAGHVTINGIDLHAHPHALQGVVGVVPQDDLLFEELTVRQNLDYNARLCLAHLTPAQRRARVDQTLRELRQEEIADLKVGSPLDKTISGGQRKRLNVALELIREPPILFVDEPTSGLSSADSDVVMGLLKEQAAQGRLVVAIVHQPSSNLFRLFDSLWMLDRGGVPIYQGHPLEAARHFRETAHLAGADRGACPACGNLNPEQLFAIVESKQFDPDGRISRDRTHPPEFWEVAWRRAQASPPPASADPENAPPPARLHRPPWPKQLAIFFSRTLRARLATRAYLCVNAIEPPLLAALTAWLCRASPGPAYALSANPYLHVYFFMAVVVAIFLGLSVSAEEIVRDRRILRRERFLHLRWTAYAGAKLLYVLLLCALQSGACALVGSAMLGLPGFFPKLWLALFSAASFGAILGLNVSARVEKAVTAYVLLPLLLLPQMLLGGLIVSFDDLRSPRAPHAYPPLLAELAASRWAFEALAVEQFQANPYQRHFLDVDRDLSRIDYLANDYLPALAGRIDAAFLDSTPPDRRRELAALVDAELSSLARQEPAAAHLPALAARLRPPDRDGLDELKSALRQLSQNLRDQRQTVQRRRNDIQNELLAIHGEDGLSALVQRHANRKIADLARNRAQLAPLREQGGRLVRLSDPIYQSSPSPFGRAPFMAGAKRIGPLPLSTYAYNLAALWLLNLALAAALAIRPKT
jgi:ABC transport system ATP-binding/permease protein